MGNRAADIHRIICPDRDGKHFSVTAVEMGHTYMWGGQECAARITRHFDTYQLAYAYAQGVLDERKYAAERTSPLRVVPGGGAEHSEHGEADDRTVRTPSQEEPA